MAIFCVFLCIFFFSPVHCWLNRIFASSSTHFFPHELVLFLFFFNCIFSHENQIGTIETEWLPAYFPCEQVAYSLSYYWFNFLLLIATSVSICAREKKRVYRSFGLDSIENCVAAVWHAEEPNINYKPSTFSFCDKPTIVNNSNNNNVNKKNYHFDIGHTYQKAFEIIK